MDDKKLWKNKDSDSLFKAIVSLKNLADAENFFRDLLTLQEIETITERFKVARLLYEGESYRSISRKTKASTTTITRVNQWLTRGMNGYKKAIENGTNKSHHRKTKSIVL